MSYLEELRQSRNKEQVAYQDFALHTRQGKNGLFCFFEGKDNAYYVPRIKQFIQDYHPIKCGGRDKVLKVHRLIANHSEYDSYKKAFFIDKDFNPPLPPQTPPIFETPCYSIENFYVSITVFKEILINALHLSEVSKAYETCVELYEARQLEYHNATLLFNAWYASLIQEKNQTGNKTGVNLEDKFPKGFIQFSLQSIVQCYDIDKIKKKFTHALEISEDNLNSKIEEFSNSEQHKVFRGKYELQFVVQLIEKILEDSKPENQHYFKEKINFDFSGRLNNAQALSLFSNYTETPDSLVDYLKQSISDSTLN